MTALRPRPDLAPTSPQSDISTNPRTCLATSPRTRPPLRGRGEVSDLPRPRPTTAGRGQIPAPVQTARTFHR